MGTIRIGKEIEDIAFEGAWNESDLSPCLKKKVGAVLIDMHQGIGRGEINFGHGGAVVPCTECVRKKYKWQQDGCWSVHSEMRAILDALSMGRKDFSKCVMFVTHGPCDQCIKLCHLMGIPLMIYDEDYHNDYSKWEGKIKIQKRGELHELDLP